ncbi:MULTISPECIES: hypothetical protein [Psychrilyobacter]|uniref:Uncharacterized protein n=1 Tax=Psychrilyobacter piezotolerans TaxID=2293438 RepID=A0ABX9KD33_9FUSO|nr:MULTISPECIES: hypothetical protein [Psychrilyobacter]MCS5423202.1 hypothetical protein [Psychrilyobacter sp. S5]NDI77872.1 hypothetical protein [Psychrilyobacter piezotolerans]RDE58769.1 hypothetical protein DV867_15540 [Psychrilyobacter sp. S5]REI39243.1 hypothetical protein DYH56_15540 [Psychrilyobacter piezotolerans]
MKKELKINLTKSGKKYHRERCRYNKNTRAMSVGEARGIRIRSLEGLWRVGNFININNVIKFEGG